MRGQKGFAGGISRMRKAELGVCANCDRPPSSNERTEVDNTPGKGMALELSITRVVPAPFELLGGVALLLFLCSKPRQLNATKEVALSPEYRKLHFSGFAQGN